MDDTQPTGVSAPLVVAISAVVTGLATAAAVWVLIETTPPCGGPFCFYALLWLPASGVVAAIVAIAIGWLAGAARGRRRIGASLLGGVVGYVVTWQIVSGGALF